MAIVALVKKTNVNRYKETLLNITLPIIPLFHDKNQNGELTVSTSSKEKNM